MQLQLFPDPAPDPFVGLFVFSRRGREERGGGGVVVGEVGRVGVVVEEVGQNREHNV